MNRDVIGDKSCRTGRRADHVKGKINFLERSLFISASSGFSRGIAARLENTCFVLKGTEVTALWALHQNQKTGCIVVS
jgi:hypothetical protein